MPQILQETQKCVPKQNIRRRRKLRHIL
jgi:hypothetical protein